MRHFLILALTLALAVPQSSLKAEEDAAPELPKAEDLKDIPASLGDEKAEVEIPQGEPEQKKETVSVLHKKPGHFRWGNFFLGALGGALLGSVWGISSGSTGSAPDGGGLSGEKLAIWAGGGALAGGVLSVLLGATTPLPETPPDMSLIPEAPMSGSAKQLVFTLKF